ncbi:MAG: AraC family transcriptional regulator [Pseudomonadota bacterium]
MKDMVDLSEVIGPDGVIRAFDARSIVRKLDQNVVEPTDYDIATGRFLLRSHSSEIGASDDCTLILSLTSEGNLSWDVGISRGESNVRPGILTFVPSQNAQRYEFDGVTTNTVLCINRSLFDRIGEIDPRLGSSQSLDARMCWIQPSIQKMVEQQYRVMAAGEVGWRVLSESLGLQIGCEILKAFGGQKSAKASRAALNQTEVERIVDYIESALERNFDLSDLAKLVDQDLFAFSRSFKAATGITPHQFVIQRRLMRVKDLLGYSDFSLAEIAYATGFSSQSHMTATFSKHVGVPPGTYRRELRS